MEQEEFPPTDYIKILKIELFTRQTKEEKTKKDYSTKHSYFLCASP
jgi:hypothetical protein